MAAKKLDYCQKVIVAISLALCACVSTGSGTGKLNEDGINPQRRAPQAKDFHVVFNNRHVGVYGAELSFTVSTKIKDLDPNASCSYRIESRLQFDAADKGFEATPKSGSFLVRGKNTIEIGYKPGGVGWADGDPSFAARLSMICSGDKRIEGEEWATRFVFPLTPSDGHTEGAILEGR